MNLAPALAGPPTSTTMKQMFDVTFTQPEAAGAGGSLSSSAPITHTLEGSSMKQTAVYKLQGHCLYVTRLYIHRGTEVVCVKERCKTY